MHFLLPWLWHCGNWCKLTVVISGGAERLCCESCLPASRGGGPRYSLFTFSLERGSFRGPLRELDVCPQNVRNTTCDAWHMPTVRGGRGIQRREAESVWSRPPENQGLAGERQVKGETHKWELALNSSLAGAGGTGWRTRSTRGHSWLVGWPERHIIECKWARAPRILPQLELCEILRLGSFVWIMHFEKGNQLNALGRVYESLPLCTIFVHFLGFERGIPRFCELFQRAIWPQKVKTHYSWNRSESSLEFTVARLEERVVGWGLEAGQGWYTTPWELLTLPWFSVLCPRISNINILSSAASGSWFQDYITSLSSLLHFHTLLWLLLIIADIDHIIAWVSISHWLPFPQARVCSHWKQLV